ELRNVLERAAVVCNGSVIRLDHLPESLRNSEPTQQHAVTAIDRPLKSWVASRLQDGYDHQRLHDELEGKLLNTLLPHYGGKPTVLANALNMNRATLRRKLRSLQSDAASDSPDGSLDTSSDGDELAD